MKGLELSRAFYEAHGRPMLQRDFPALFPKLAIGLVGSGSECYGFDDTLSQDHDFEPGFCIFLPDESVVDRRGAFLLERAYAKLPKTFMGYDRSPLSPVGGNRHGVIRTADFYLEKTGTKDGSLSPEAWLNLPEYALLEATNGAVFEDPYGEFSRIRATLSRFPEPIRQKKLAGHLLLMGQSGQYNYPRCIKRKETAAAQMALFEFVQSALHVAYLLERRYTPYYKWVFRGMTDRDLAEKLETLISTGNTPREALEKEGLVEAICQTIAQSLGFPDLEMERLAYTVNDAIRDASLRNLHILSGV